MRRKLGLLMLIMALVVVGSSAYIALRGVNADGSVTIPPGITLLKPAIAQVVSFLDEEAGIAAYTNIESQIDLESAATAFRVIERQTESWIVGTVEISGETEEIDPHVFVHETGWIVAYYDRDTPVATALHWVGFDLGLSHLEQALGDVAASAGAPVQSLGFYNFRFPDATEWLVILDSDSFDLTTPQEFLVFERSFAMRATASCCTTRTFTLNIDGSVIGQMSVPDRATKRSYGGISASQLVPGVSHEVAISGSGTEVMAISLLFKEG